MRLSPCLAAVLTGLTIIAGCNPGSQIRNDNEPPVPTAEPLDQRPQSEDSADSFRVKFETTAGDFVMRVQQSWAPKGAARFRELVESGFYDGCRFFRVVPGFVVQFGINGDPNVQSKWRDNPIPDDPPNQSNKRGRVTFAHGGPETRSTQVFINFKDNPGLDGANFSPIAEVIEGMKVVDSINSQYGERPDQTRVQFEGNAYLNAEFPKLDYIKRATIVTSKPGQATQDGRPADADQPGPAVPSGQY